MTWKTAHRSFYYANAEEPDDIALLVFDQAQKEKIKRR